MYHFTDRTLARAQLGERLLQQLDRASAAGLIASDLEDLAKHGREAEVADREQQAQLAAELTDRTMKSDNVAALKATETQIRSISVAVVDDLRGQGHEPEARFLANLSYARFRIRELRSTPADGSTAAEAALVRSLERVEREDMPTRMKGLAGYCGAVTAEGREIIADAFAARGMDRATLEDTAAKANALAEGGRNVRLSVEATRREHEAAKAQSAKWRAVRRLVRTAVAGDTELTRLYAEC